jgi:hypothetical protein
MRAFTHPEHAESHATHLQEGYFMGCLPAEVTSVNDPNKAGRIKARAKLIDEFNDLPNAVDGWIPVTTRYVLTDTPGGDLAPLQVGSQVILLPIMGRMDNWICIGAIHTSAEPPHPAHSLNDGSYGEHTPEGISHIRTGDAAEIKSYPSGVVKGVTATGDVITKTTETTITQSVDGKVHVENKLSSMSLSPSGTVGIVNATGSAINLDDKGAVSVASAHKSSMSFVDGKVEIAGPPNKAVAGNVDDYRKSISKSIGGLNDMFSNIASINLGDLNSENINSLVGTVNDVIAKGQAVVADYELAKDKAQTILDGITNNPLEALKIIAPQVSEFIDNNLDKVMPLIKEAIESKVGGAGVLEQISAYLPAGLSGNAAAIQARISSFKTNPQLAASAIISDIYGTATSDYESLLGANIEYSVGKVMAIHKSVPPVYPGESIAAVQLLINQDALATTLSGAAKDRSLNLDLASPAEIAAKVLELHKVEPEFLKQAIAAAWRKQQVAQVRLALPKSVAKKLSEITIESIVDAPTPTGAIERLALAVQAANLKTSIETTKPLDQGVRAIGSSSTVLEQLDKDDKDAALYELLGLAGNSSFSNVGVLFAEVEQAELEPIVKDVIGDFTKAIDGVYDRLNARFKQEDPLCQSSIRFVFQEIGKYKAARISHWQRKNKEEPGWSINQIALTFHTDQLANDTRKYAVAYPAINLFWDDLKLSINEFVRVQKEVDKKIAYQVIAAQLRAKSLKLDADKAKRIVAGKEIPDDWQAPESFDPSAFKELIEKITQLGINLADIPDLSGGCDSSDAKVLAAADYEVKETLARIRTYNQAKIPFKAGVLEGMTPMPFKILSTAFDNFESGTARYKLTAKIRTDALNLFKDTIDDLFDAERQLARTRHIERQAKDKQANRLSYKPTEANQIAYAIAIMEYRNMGARLLVTTQDKTRTIDYAQSVSRVVAELNVVIQNWFQRNSTGNSAAELIDLPGLKDLSGTVQKFIKDRSSYQTEFPQINLIWDEILRTLDYILYYPVPEKLQGANTIVRNAEVKLPGTYAQTVPGKAPTTSEGDWLQAMIVIAKAVLQDITNLYPPFKEYQLAAVQVLDTLPSVFPAAKMTLTDGKIDMKASNTGAKVSLGQENAKIASGGGAAAVNLGAGNADITTGAMGGALKLGAGNGELSGGPASGKVSASAGGATLSGPGGIGSIGVGAGGGLIFSTPWGGFGFGSGGFGLSGDQPVNFMVQENDYDGGAAALYLDSRKGVGIHSTEIYTNFVNAEINVFDGRISIGCPRNVNARIEVNENGVTIGGVNMSYFGTQFGYIFARLLALENA